MAPYRTVERDQRAEAPREPGIVGEVIAQFADPLAFFRELTQNAIDAGTPSVEVRLEHDDAAQVLRASVRDRGEGMTRETIEQQLLVLFRSTKERDATKIGKFGIGFASVLSPGPRIVIVHTARAGRRLTLHLHPDLTYELFDAGPATQPGTTVQLELPMSAAEAVAFAGRSRDALVRWCRHAAVPIQLHAGVDAAHYERTERIDRPLALEGALVEVRGTADGGALIAAVGIQAPGSNPYAGFFNHGLMLHEAAEPLLGALAVKLQDARLGHTLSRDNVRRDARFERAVAFARELAATQLPAAAAAALRAAAEAPDRARYGALAAAVAASGVELRADAWAVPLVEPIDGRGWCTAAQLPRTAWWATAPGALTAALARAGVPVIHADEADGAEPLAQQLGRYTRRLASARAELTAVAPIASTPAEAAMLDELRAFLDAAHRAPSAIWLARLDGALAAQPAICGGPDDAVHAPDDAVVVDVVVATEGGEAGGAAGGAPGRAPGDVPTGPTFLLEREAAQRTPFGRLRRPPLVLSADHPIVAAARAAATADPARAAGHLARVVLLHYRLLDVARSTAILERALDAALDPPGAP